MRNHLSISIAVAVLALALAAGCKRTEVEPSPTETTAAREERPTAPEKPAAIPPTLSTGDKEFITKAAQEGMLEVAVNREAARKAVSPDIKAFADKMVTEQGKVNDELKQLAAKKGVTLPTALDSENQDKLDKLAKLSGDKFDKEYADDIVDEHKDDVDEYKKASTDLNDPELRAFAQKTLPALESNLANAKTVEAKAKAIKR